MTAASATRIRISATMAPWLAAPIAIGTSITHHAQASTFKNTDIPFPP
ncbi:hypothetical protein [Sphingobium fuliginis]|nr:hypothetical protein [Sphingobium fuliginis]